MENFIVSARKYRPATFDSVVGQAHVTNTLKNAIRNNHLAQAFLFCGPRGVGKTTCARILAKTINCQNLSENTEPCNTCESCLAFNQSASFNIYELDAASNNSVEDIRALVEQVRYAPQGARYKIYIIDEVHMLSTSAFNAFLKTLEEPPSYAIFILATTERHKILPTILSRCQIFDFKRIRVADIADHLQNICTKENVKADTEALHVIAQKADGALRDALSIYDQMVSFSGSHLTYSDVIQNLNILDYDYYFKVTDAMQNRDISNILLIYDEILRKGFDGQIFLNGLMEHFRNLLVCKDESTLQLLEVAETIGARYRAQTKACSASFLLNALNIANQYDVTYKGSRNQRLHVELALMKICHIQSVLELAQEDPGAGDKKKTEPVTKEIPVALTAPVSSTATKPQAAEITPPPVTVNRIGPLKNLDPTKLKKPDPVIETPSVQEREAPLAETPVTDFTAQQLEKAWLDFANEQLKASKKSLAILMKGHLPVRENDLIKVTIASQIELDLFKEVELDLLLFLKTALKYTAITLHIEKQTDMVNDTRQPYTAMEKFRAMAEDNPDLLDLRRLLDLDLD